MLPRLLAGVTFAVAGLIILLWSIVAMVRMWAAMEAKGRAPQQIRTAWTFVHEYRALCPEGKLHRWIWPRLLGGPMLFVAGVFLLTGG